MSYSVAPLFALVVHYTTGVWTALVDPAQAWIEHLAAELSAVGLPSTCEVAPDGIAAPGAPEWPGRRWIEDTGAYGCEMIAPVLYHSINNEHGGWESIRLGQNYVWAGFEHTPEG